MSAQIVSHTSAQSAFEYTHNGAESVAHKRAPRAKDYSIEVDIVTPFGSFFVLVNIDPIVTSHGAFYDLHNSIIRDIIPLFNPDINYFADLYIGPGILLLPCMVDPNVMNRLKTTGCTMILTVQSQLASTV